MSRRKVKCRKMGRKVGLNITSRRFDEGSEKCRACCERDSCKALTACKPRPVGIRFPNNKANNKDGRYDGRNAPQMRV